MKNGLTLKKKPNGEKKYTGNTIIAYIQSLRTACKSITDVKFNNTDLFYETSSESFDELQKAIRSSHDFDSVISKAGNGAFSAGINLYLQFLKEREEDDLYGKEDSEISLEGMYKNKSNGIKIWKVSHGNNGSFTEEERVKYLEQKIILVHYTTGKSQGKSFVNDAKSGDCFYLCFGNDGIKLFGRILSNKAVINPDKGNGWMQRNYEIISDSKDTNSKYDDIMKGWTPNYNSTFMSVPSNELDLFEQKILFPYFNLHLSDLQAYEHTSVGSHSEELNYWWLNASPKIWSFSSIEVGQEVDYTSINENGNHRKVYKNFEDAKVGEIVIGYESYPVKAIVSICRISKSHNGERIWVEKLENLVTPIEYSKLLDIPELQNMEYFHTPRGSLFKLTTDEYNELIDIIREQNPLTVPAQTPLYTREDFLADVFIDYKTYDTLKELLLRKKNIILQGAPGVGKTYAAKRLAYSIMGKKDNSRIMSVQFHQSYSYEDFIMGYRPDESGFSLKYGVFYKFCKLAENNRDKPYFFIIDEINRGNLSKIFGELLMLIECDKRGEEMILAYSDIPFSVPDNLYIIGMMNTADRSLAIIDYALRRRFCFFELEPAFGKDIFSQYLLSQGVTEELTAKINSKLNYINNIIENDPNLGRCFRIGHSYFCNCENSSNDWFDSIISYEIAPLLDEYWFDDPETAKNHMTELFR